MKGIKVLQWATVGTFLLFAGMGIALVLLAPERIPAFTQLLASIWPLFVAEVVPAFLGTPLKEFVRNQK